MADWKKLHETPEGQRPRGQNKKMPERRPFETFWSGRNGKPNYKAILWDTLFFDCGFPGAYIARAFNVSSRAVVSQVNYIRWEYGRQNVWAKENPESYRKYQRKWHTDKMNSDWNFRFKTYMNGLVQHRPEYLRDIESWSPEDRQRVSDIYEKCYRLCQEHGPATYHVDHIVPYAVGGRHVPDNLRILTRSENTSRPKDGSDILNPDDG